MKPFIPAIAAAIALALPVTVLPVAAHAREQTVEIKNYMFMTITIAAGDKVTWVNRDDVPHTVIEQNRLFHSAALDTGDSYSYVFAKPGTYTYFCSLHPQMVAKVVVTDAPAVKAPVGLPVGLPAGLNDLTPDRTRSSPYPVLRSHWRSRLAVDQAVSQ